MDITFLGSADSAGIPVHNCQCEVCQSYRKEERLNLSTMAYIQTANGVILLDAGQDLLCEAFDEEKILAVFLTHFHADHCMGLLRLRHSKENITCFHPMDDEGFSDLFKHKHAISYNSIEPFETIECDGITFTAISLKHSKNCLGYVIETPNSCLAYLTDCSGIDPFSMNYLKKHDFDYIFIDACYDVRKQQGNHLNYEQASNILDELNVKEGYLMHQSHETLEYIAKQGVVLKYPYVQEYASFKL